MSIVWRMEQHQWQDFVYPDGRSVKVLVVPMHHTFNSLSRKTKRAHKGIRSNLADEIATAIKELGPSTVPVISAHIRHSKKRVRDSLLWNWRRFDRVGRSDECTVWAVKESA